MAWSYFPSSRQGLVFGIIVWLLYYVYWQLTTGTLRRRLIRENGCKPVKSFPQKDPILGLDVLITQFNNIRDHRLLEGTVERFNIMEANTFSMPLLRTKVFSTCEPENLKHIQSLQFKNFGIPRVRSMALDPLIGKGIFTMNGADWQHSREMLRPSFARSQVGDLETLEKHLTRLIHLLPRDGSTVDLQVLFFHLTIDSATELLFGESTNTLAPGTSSESSRRFAEAFDRGQEAAVKNIRIGPISRLIPSRQFREDCQVVRQFAQRFVEKSVTYTKAHNSEQQNSRYVFSRELARQTPDMRQIGSELLNVLLAGRDTTAGLLANLWFTLAREPRVWAKLQAEIAQLGGERPSFDQIKDMKYLRYTLNECLRLYPSVPINIRETLIDTVLPLGGGPDGKSPAFVSKGQLVVWSVWAMHRRKDLYGEDADEFKPERWETLRPGWRYIPFNAGPRICLGQQLALTDASYVTIRLMQEFQSIANRDPEPWRERLTLTLASCGGTRVSLTPR